MPSPTSQTDRLTAALSAANAGYRIERELGAGGMATVYLAEDLKHDRKVAIKVLKPELAAVLGAERFVVEIKTTAAMSHPHILPLFDSGTADGFLFYVMPYIQGETIREKLNRETQFGVDEAVRIAREVADALDYAHRHGVIHRDIKPENILLHDGRAMVMDFGIALAVSAAAGGRMTETGLSLGTPHYMSPEQATAEKEITARSDIYSLASVLYEMLAGEPPHTAGNAQAVIMKIITDVARPVHQLRRNVPPNVDAALAKALEKLPPDRFESAKAFSEALGNPHYTDAGGQRGHARAHRHGTRGVLAVLPWAVAALAAGVAIFLARRLSAPEPAPELRVTIPTHGVEPGAGDFPQSLGISADGRTVAYVAGSSGVNRIYIRELADRNTRVLAGTDGANGLAFSPDGRSILFATTDRRISTVPVNGGAVATVANSNGPAGMAWSAKFGPVFGMISFSRDIHGLTTVGEARDTALKSITEPGEGAMDHWPIVLEDGSTVFFTRMGSGGGRRSQAAGGGGRRGGGRGGGRAGDRAGGLGRVSLPSGEPEVFDLPIDRPVGVSDGVLVYLDRGNNLMAVALDNHARPSGQSIRVGDLGGSIRSAALSPSGVLVALVKPTAYQVVMLDKRGEGPVILPDTVTTFVPRFSPDGRRVAFSANRGRVTSLWLLDVATQAVSKFPRAAIAEWSSDSRRLLGDSAGQFSLVGAEAADAVIPLGRSTGGARFSVSLAPDRSAIATGIGFTSTGWDILVRPLVGDTSVVRFAESDANERAPRFSPDSKWLAYESDELGHFEVYVQPYPGPGARVQVSAGGGMSPTWSKDGRRLFYRAGRTMMAAELSMGSAVNVLKRQSLFSGDFLADDGFGIIAYDVAPDGDRFVMARSVTGGGAELELWTGWLQDVKKRLAGGK